MSNLREKAIELAKQTSSESAFMCGYDRACQEYEEKLRWIPVEEKLPEKNTYIKKQSNGNTLYFYDIYLVKGFYHNEAKSDGKMSAFYVPCSVSWYFQVPNNFTVTEWRYFL